MQVSVRVIPKASKNKVTIDSDGSLKVYTTSAPTDGKANLAVIKLLAEHFSVSKSSVKIIRGITSRDKVFEIG